MENKSLHRDEVSDEEKSLIAPCGIYCGACDIFLGRSRELARELHRIMNGFNFADVGPFFMGIERQQILAFLDMLEKWSQADRCPGCWSGGGNPFCPVKACAQNQGFLACAECDRMPCHAGKGTDAGEGQDTRFWMELVTRRYARWNIDNLNRVREVGYRRFIDEMQEKVQSGFLTSDVISGEPVVTEAFKGTAQGD